MRFVSAAGIRSFIITAIFIFPLLCPIPGNALPTAPGPAGDLSADSGRLGSNSFLFAPEKISVRMREGFPLRASSGFGVYPAAVIVESMFRGPSAEPQTETDDGLFDTMTPLFIGSILIGLAGIIRKFGTVPEPVERFVRMGVESPYYKKAVSS